MAHIFYAQLAAALAFEVWNTVRKQMTRKQLAGATGILSYETRDTYVAAFVKAFEISVTMDGAESLQAVCLILEVKTSTMFIKNHW